MTQNVKMTFRNFAQNSNKHFFFNRQHILDEQAKYDDILQADMVEHYYNLTLKSVFTLKFFINESNFDDPPPFHLMKIDSDTYLNLPQLIKILKYDKRLKKSPMHLLGNV